MSNEEKLQQKVEQQEAEIQRLNKEIDNLKHQLSVVNKLSFGHRSEKTEYIANGQISLFNEAETEEDKKERAKEKPVVVAEHTRKQKRTREEIAKDLPVEEVVISVPEEERRCDRCGSEMHTVGKEFVRDELVYVPEKLYIRKIYIETLKCDTCGTDESRDKRGADIETASFRKATAPKAMIPRSFCTPELLAHIICEKYVKSVPLYRQEKDFAAKDVYLSRATMANWIIYAAKEYFQPVYERLKKELLAGKVIHADETVVQVLNEPGKKPKTESRMWVYCSGENEKRPIVLFEYRPTRSGDWAKRFLGDFSGYLVTDGYAGYNKLNTVTHCGCWAHARRKFAEALPAEKEAADTSMAAKGVRYIDDLFSYERACGSIPEREKMRKEKSVQTVEEFYEWMDTFTPTGAGLQKAVGYAKSMKNWLTAFLHDPEIPLSNNRAENAIRPFCVGRKNWLFSNSVPGAQASAIVYSLVETAKANGIKPEKYFISLLKN